jgi:apolipoprotein N-acyltransferase
MAVPVGTNGSGAATAPRRTGWSERLVLAVLSGGMLAAAFPSLDLGFLAWVALVPVLRVIRTLRVREAFATGWVAGLAFYVGGTYWVVYTIDHYTRLPLVVAVGLLLLMSSVLACYVGAFAAGVRWCDRRAGGLSWVVAPALWVTLEWMRGWFFIGFPWNALGYSQHRFHDLVQMAEVTGVYGVSAVLILFNVVLADVIGTRGLAVRRHLPALLTATTLLVVLPGLGRWRVQTLAARAPVGTVRVGIAQGNVDQERKWDPAFQDETMRRYAALTRDAGAAGAELVVWPETAVPFFFQDPGMLREGVLNLARAESVALLVGSPAYRPLGSERWEQTNRAYLVGPDGMERDWYDKMQLVPFGEYVPFARVFFFVERMVESVGGMAPGRRATVFDGPSGRCGVLICYEGIFPALSRRLVGGGADYLVNVTNDAWYGRTSAPHQHLVQATFRAIENRVPMVRAANTGISAVVGADGRLAWSGALDQQVWHVADVAYGDTRTFYTRFGDVFVWLCVLVTLAAVARGVWRRSG